MKKIIFFSAIFFFLASSSSFAQTQNVPLANVSGYVIDNFQSEILVNQDTSLAVTETIKVNYLQAKHGIFRIIPVIYSANAQTIRADLKILSITDENGQAYLYETSRYNQSIKIKIGDPNRTITGQHTYLVRYTINKVLLRYTDHDEVYWNVTGSEWDATISSVSATVKSPFAPIKQVDCYSGVFGSKEKFCQTEFTNQEARFQSTKPLGRGYDFTVVVGLNPQNQLQFPGPIQRIIIFIFDNWGYPLSLMPLLVMFYLWYHRGRDQKYLGDNVYYVPDDQKTKTASIFEHQFLPTVYSPIDKVTPSQVGTIIDEKVDLQDVVAEIIELARLGFIEIKKIEKKKFFGLIDNTDYLFIKKDKDPKDLKDYQQYLLDKLFLCQKFIDLLKKKIISGAMGAASVIVPNDFFDREPESYKSGVLLSSLTNHFYQYLDEFKKKLYQSLVDEKIFYSNPETTKALWLGLSIGLLAIAFTLDLIFAITTFNAVPLAFHFLIIFPTILLSRAMPRRQAWGYSLYRQTEGLKYYLTAGKWREEIHEKRLFFEEILPLAIALGIVHQLAKDMADLAIEPPSYLTGFTANTFANDFNYFNSSLNHNLVSSPSSSSGWSGHSSWSGGSGFGGGSSGGGFGGGGGGSW